MMMMMMMMLMMIRSALAIAISYDSCWVQRWRVGRRAGKWLRKNLGFFRLKKPLEYLKSPKFRFLGVLVLGQILYKPY